MPLKMILTSCLESSKGILGFPIYPYIIIKWHFMLKCLGEFLFILLNIYIYIDKYFLPFCY